MTDDRERIEGTAEMLLAAVREAGHWISGDGRVREETAADLLGIAVGTLANWRSAGTAPPHYSIGRPTYRLIDLAAWIEAARINS